MSKDIYIIQCEQYLKIGISDNPDSRIKDMQTGNPFELKILWTGHPRSASIAEKYCHCMLRSHHVRGEWFSCSKEEAEKVTSKACGMKVNEMAAAMEGLPVPTGLSPAQKRQCSNGLAKAIINSPSEEMVVLDKGRIESILTNGCGLKYESFRLLGFRGPQRGWKKKIIGREVPASTYDRLVELASFKSSVIPL